MSGIKAGSAYVELSVKDKIQQGLDNARAKLDKFSAAFSAATGGFFGGLIGANFGSIIGKVGEVLNMADEIADSSAKIGMSAESYQRLSFAAEQSGTTIDAVAASQKKFSVLIGKAELGNTKAAATLDKYGLSLEQLKGMTPEQQLQKVADVIGGMSDQTSKAAAAVELLGRGGIDLLPMLSGGADGVANLGKQAEALGLVSKEEDIQRAGRLADVWATTKAQFARVAVVMYNALVPAFEKGAEVTRGLLAWTIAFVDKNRGLVRVLFGIVGAISLATAAYIGYQLAAYAATAAMAVYSAAVSVATTAAMAFNVATMGLPLIVGGIIAALVAVVGATLYFAGAFSGLSDIAKATMSGIYDAIAGGNIGLAWQIATTGMHIAWLQFQMNVIAAWNKAVEYIIAKTESLRASWRSYMQEFSEGMNIISGGTFGNQYRGSGRAERTGKPEAKADPLQAKIDALTGELTKLNMQAAEERAKLSGGEVGKPEKFDSEALLASLDKGGLAGAGANAFSNTGTFSSAAVGLLGSPAISVQEKILKEAEKQTGVLEEIAEDVAVEDGVFS